MTGLTCTGQESDLQYCRHDGKVLKQCGDPSRSVLQYAGVVCTESNIFHNKIILKTNYLEIKIFFALDDVLSNGS